MHGLTTSPDCDLPVTPHDILQILVTAVTALSKIEYWRSSYYRLDRNNTRSSSYTALTSILETLDTLDMLWHMLSSCSLSKHVSISTWWDLLSLFYMNSLFSGYFRTQGEVKIIVKTVWRGDGLMECDREAEWRSVTENLIDGVECVDRRRGRGREYRNECVTEMWRMGRCVTEGGQRWRRCDRRGLNLCVVPSPTEPGVR